MKSSKGRELVSRIYDNVEIALWAMLLAFVIYIIAFVLPNMPEIQAQRARVEMLEIGTENASLCEKLNIKRGTDNYNQCLLDVGAFRIKVGKRIYDEFEF